MLERSLCALALAFAISGCGTNEASTLGASHVDDETSDGGGGEDGSCVFTQGYWKNHPDAWPVDTLVLGSVSYSKDELLSIFHTPVKGNGLIQLAHQLIAAKLNVANGGSSSIAGAIADADALIGGLVCPPVGDGHLATHDTSDLTESLDDYNNHGECGNTPPPPTCGDGHVDAGESCDDGNTVDGDGCSSGCTCECPPPAPVCGDGHVDAGEACDDGNTANGDGCSSTCTVEPPPSSGVCGDGHVDAGEGCDDGNTVDGDGCSSTCTCESHPQTDTVSRMTDGALAR